MIGQAKLEKIDVLDKGYVRLVRHMGNDLEPVNDAKASFDRQSEEFGIREAKLLAFLAREGHTSPFRGSVLKFEAYAPLFVARQWYKHVVASLHVEDQNGWNETSRRYLTENNEYYLPDREQWREAPENKKQGSGALLQPDKGFVFSRLLREDIARSQDHYELALRNHIAPEQARLFLNAYALYIRWRWTASLGAVTHFIALREAKDAQKEIQDYAVAVRELTRTVFPNTVQVYFGDQTSPATAG